MCEGRLNFTNVWFAYYNTHYNAVNMRLKVKNTIIKLLFLIKLFRNQNSKPYFKTARLHFLENILVIFKCFLQGPFHRFWHILKFVIKCFILINVNIGS